MEQQQTYHIHLCGIVQGVGFRPFVYNKATAMGLQGRVSNGGDGVHIIFNATEAAAENFYAVILAQKPQLAVITAHSMCSVPKQVLGNFEIVQSIQGQQPVVPLTPDFALCADCRAELHNPANRRYGYPFITCTHCGPRYSIVTELPYDRERTAMQPFAMCQACLAEYNNPADRRYYAQTNSCSECGVVLQLYDAGGQLVQKGNEPVLTQMVKQLQAGSILAVKGIGGYLLLCDATNTASIQTLRQRKQRPAKPFAVMFTDISQLEAHAIVSQQEKACLLSPVSPVVLLQAHSTTLPMELIAPGLSTIGAMLPGAPLFEIVLHRFGKPLIATSANISGSPIIYRDADALAGLRHIADYIVAHNRDIVTPQDDSVVQFYTDAAKPIIMRRSRGMAPSCPGGALPGTGHWLAAGALMKSSFTLYANQNLLSSQYLGSTETVEAQTAYQAALQHLMGISHTVPAQLIADKHPGYFSHQLAHQLASVYRCAVTEVQHHKAHFAAVLAEHQLLDAKEPVLGVIWDGSGLGDDGQLWGGEFFKYEKGSMLRCCFFDYFPYLLGDKMAREPRIAALAVCHNVPEAGALLEPGFTVAEWALYKKMLAQYNGLLCSSAGRIFDAVAGLLHMPDKQTYEGEAALYLQTMAAQYMATHGDAMEESYFTDAMHYCPVPTALLFSGIVKDIANGRPKEFIAAKFHHSLVHIIAIIAGIAGTAKLAFSGGVFQNALLVRLLQTQLGRRFRLYFHQQLSPNDENISFGQLQYYARNVDGIKNQNSAAAFIPSSKKAPATA